MFEIRIICDPADTERITTALSGTFDTATVRRLPSRHSDMERLYVTADHRTDGPSWPDPETAYTTAPGVVYEIGWVAHYATNRPFGTEAVREFWLRKAALLDRIALGDTDTPADPGAAQLAIEAAGRLRDIDGADVSCDPRCYMRQQYAMWAKDQ